MQILHPPLFEIDREREKKVIGGGSSGMGGDDASWNNKQDLVLQTRGILLSLLFFGSPLCAEDLHCVV